VVPVLLRATRGLSRAREILAAAGITMVALSVDDKAGRALSPDEAVAYALGESSPSTRQ
jgi:hypothetical protein